MSLKDLQKDIPTHKLQYFQSIAGKKAPQAFLIYAGEAEQKIHTIHLLKFRHAINAVK